MAENNIIQFPRKPALFTENTRQQLVKSMGPFTDRPSEAVQEVEDTLCNAIVAGLRQIAINIGTSIGNSLAKKVQGEQREAR